MKQTREEEAVKESENWIYSELRLVGAARFLHSWLMVIPQIGGKHRLIGHKATRIQINLTITIRSRAFAKLHKKP